MFVRRIRGSAKRVRKAFNSACNADSIIAAALTSSARLGIGRGFSRRRRQLEDHFSGPCHAHIASQPLDGTRIGLQRLHLPGQRPIFPIKPRNISAKLFHFFLRAAHGQKSVRAKNVVDAKRQQPHPEQFASMRCARTTCPASSGSRFASCRAVENPSARVVGQPLRFLG